MKRIFEWVLTSAAMLSVGISCSTREVSQPEMVESKTMDIDIGVKSLDPNVKYRVFLTDALGDRVIYNEYPAKSDPVTGNHVLKIRSGYYNVYVLANEPARLTAILNSMKVRDEFLDLAVQFSELPTVEDPENGTSSATNIPSFGSLDIGVHESATNPGKAEVSLDWGATWDDIIPEIKLERVASKVSLKLKKNTPVITDEVIITNATISNIPDYGHILSKPYTSNVFHERTPAGLEKPVFNTNTTIYKDVFKDFILPPYQMTDPTDKAKAVGIKIEALYNGAQTNYYIPVRANLSVEDYSLLRNRHYIVSATIKTKGELNWIPEVEYEVADWTDAKPGDGGFTEENSFTYRADWKPGSTVNGKTVTIRNGQTADFIFNLTFPENATWTASLTNPTYFEFVSIPASNIVSYGRAKTGVDYTIRIKPRKDADLRILTTDFYITVNNGLGRNVELNLTGTSPGVNNRYNIQQVPY